MKKILLTGASGGLGREIHKHFNGKYDVQGLCFSHPTPDLIALDLRQREKTRELILSLKPELIIHTVGLTDVDLCERDVPLAIDINVNTTLNIRLAAEELGSKVIHISTNDVFSGHEGNYSESDLPQPINTYAKTKYMAEQLLYTLPQSLILRFTILSWFTSGKTAFPKWLENALTQKQTLTLFGDQYNSPLYTGSVAKMIEDLLNAEGIYHLGSERKSRYDTALAIANQMGLDTQYLTKGSVNDVNLSAPRPKDVSLDRSKVTKDWGVATDFETEISQLIAARPDSK